MSVKIIANSVVPKAAAARAVFIDSPVYGEGVPLSFCATGTCNPGVANVYVDLTDSGGRVYPHGPVAPISGYWACAVRLPSADAAEIYQLDAYEVAGDGSNCPKLHYDETLPEGNCIEVTGEKPDEKAKDAAAEAERLTGYVGPFLVTYPEPKIARDVTYEAIIAERITPPDRRFHYEPLFTTNPPRSRNVFLPNVGPGLYVVRFVFFPERGQVRTYSKAKRVQA
jgi:hypothetical protein